MTIENCASLEEAVQPADETLAPKKSLAQKYRYWLVLAMLCPGSITVPIGCATYAYNKLTDDDSKGVGKPKSEPKIQELEKGISTTLNINTDAIGGE